MTHGYVYILEDSNHKFYVGSTDNINRRLKQHHSGQTHTTKRMKELKLVFYQELESLVIARKIENRLKKLKRKDYLEKIIKDGYIRLTPP